jgi:hypothetical protein
MGKKIDPRNDKAVANHYAKKSDLSYDKAMLEYSAEGQANRPQRGYMSVPEHLNHLAIINDLISGNPQKFDSQGYNRDPKKRK